MILLLALVACQPQAPSIPTAAAAVEGAAWQTEPVQVVTWRPRAELTGSLDPIASVQLGFDVPGRIEALLVHRGDAVRAGQPLARLDARLAQAQLAQAEAAYTGASAQAANGEASFARAQKLHEAGAMSEQQFADAAAGIEAARAGVAQAKAATQLARTHVGLHTLRSPIDGIVSNGPDNPGIMTGAGTPMFLIEDLSALQIRTSAPAGSDWLHAGLPATLTAGPARSSDAPGASAGVHAQVIRVLPALDPQSRRMPVEIRIDQPDGTLHAHAFTRVRVEGDADQPAIRVPRSALIARPDFCVFVSKGPTAAPTRVAVSVLEEAGDHVIVSGPLQAGDAVVLSPPPSLTGE